MSAYFFLKMGQPRPLFCLFSSFQTNITNFTTNMNVKKCPSSIWRWDSNSQPSDYQSPPLTTRPGLPPFFILFGTPNRTWRYLKAHSHQVYRSGDSVDYGWKLQKISYLCVNAVYYRIHRLLQLSKYLVKKVLQHRLWIWLRELDWASYKNLAKERNLQKVF